MASIVLGAAGAVVGSIFGGPLGASIGWAIGSALGSMLEPKKGQEGPRLTDLHVQNSQYGVPIPLAYGTVRIAGNVIWQTDLVEHSQSSGGKGGGPKVTTYSYTLSFAVLICEAPPGGIVGISRIWANKRLRWSASSPSTNFPFTLYTGTSTQLPDPTMEADKGVGHVPAHRGYAYIVFDDIPMEEFGNAMPSLEFEVIATSGVGLERVNQWTVPQPSLQFRSAPLAGIYFDGTYFYIADYGNGSAPGSYQKNQYAFDGTFIQNVELISYSSDNPAGDFAFEINPVANSDVAALYSHDVASVSLKMYWFANGAQSSPELVAPPGATGNQNIVFGNPCYANNIIYAIGGNPAYVAAWNAPNGVPDGQILAYYFFDADTFPNVNTPSGMSVTVAEDGTVWVIGTAAVSGSGPTWHFHADMTPIQFWAETVTTMPFIGGGVFTVYLNYFAFDNGSGGLALWQFDGFAAFTLVSTDTTSTFGNAVVNIGGGYILTTDGVYKMLQPITLKSIVDDLSDRAGLLAGEYETTALTQLVNGYVISAQADIRSALEPLMTAYFADAVESGPAIKFVNRGAAPDETISDDDLSAYIEGEDLQPLVEQTRQQEQDLPRAIYVNYFDLNADYQVGTSLWKRETGTGTMEMSVAFALVLSSKEGKQIADRMAWDSIAKRRRIHFSTARKWSKLEPTDVKIVHGYTLFVTQRDEAQAGVLSFDGVATRSQIFGQSGKAGVLIGSGGFTPPTPPTASVAKLLMLDLPLIQDGDYPNGYYAAISGFSGSANLYKSSDGGTTYTSLLTTLTPDTVGHATTVLGDFFGGNVFDIINSVTVIIDAGGAALSSASALAVLNGSNEALLGSEIIQYQTATLTGTRTYVLTGLLRGRRGTEWAMSTHVTSEDFVVLPVNVNVNGSFAELGLTRLFKAVAAGQTVASATAVSFTNTGVALKPYAPVHIGGGRSAAGDITINWTRRTRIGGAWVDFADAPLSEASEDYQVHIYTDNTYVAAYNSYLVSGAQTYTYPIADQTSDSGGAITTLYVGVSQLGSYGYGYEGQAII